MSDTVILKSGEYDQLTGKIKSLHADLLSLYDQILTTMNDTVTTGGVLTSISFAPKMERLAQDVGNNLKNKLKLVFDATETAIDDYMNMISGVDAV